MEEVLHRDLVKLPGEVIKAKRLDLEVRVRPGFEGGQMPIQQRLPKFGFTSRKANLKCHIKIRDLEKLDTEIIDIDIIEVKENNKKQNSRSESSLGRRID